MNVAAKCSMSIGLLRVEDVGLPARVKGDHRVRLGGIRDLVRSKMFLLIIRLEQKNMDWNISGPCTCSQKHLTKSESG